MTNADLLITMVLNEGRKLIQPNNDETRKTSKTKVERRGRDYADALNQGRQRDFSYGLGRSRNHHLNAVVRHILPSLSMCLRHTNLTTDPMSLELAQGLPENHPNGGMGYTRVAAHFKSSDGPDRIIWDEYHRHLNDLADHIDKHVKRMSKKMNFVSPLKRHDTVDHRGFGFDTSELGEIMTAHYNPHSADPGNTTLVHPADDHLRVLSRDRLVAMLDRYYRGNQWAKRGYRTSQDPRNFGGVGYDVPPYERVKTPAAAKLVAASKKISIRKGWEDMIARNVEAKAVGLR